ncbi:MAG: hypothetical protein Q8M18_20910 [Bradyrhizobium sp.]|nr:hypothetical protein [Bradyrhizobium sp.]
MDKFIHKENVALLKKRLAEATDERTRQVLLRLLAEEEAKVASSSAKS